MFALESTFEIVITGDIEKADTKNMLETVRKNFLPNAVIIFVPDGQDREALTAMLPYIKDYKPVNDRATAYVCKNFSCQAPTNDIDELGLI